MDKRALHPLGLRTQSSGSFLVTGSHSVKHLLEVMNPAGQRARRFFVPPPPLPALAEGREYLAGYREARRHIN